jgi:pSer/pThr/pTyr-binding forkhead associated (FHA) protein
MNSDVANQYRPLCTGQNHPLPFDALDPQTFERLCLWLVQREGYSGAEHLGAAGGDHARDILAWKDGQCWAFQCKRVKEFGPTSAAREIERLFDLTKDRRPATFVFVVTTNVSAKTRDVARADCRKQGLECEIWSVSELDERVRRYPDLLANFFQIRSSGISGTPENASIVTEVGTASRIRLRQVAPATEVKPVESQARSVTIGRGPANTVRLEDREVSWEHGVIYLLRGAYHYRHLSSTNPTMLRRKGEDYLFRRGQMDEIEIRNQDRLSVGKTTFVVELARVPARLLKSKPFIALAI